MGLVQKFKDMFTEYDDEYDDELEPAPEIEDFDQIKRETGSNYSEMPNMNRSKVVNIHATTQLQVMLVKPERSEDARSHRRAFKSETHCGLKPGVRFQRALETAFGLFKRRRLLPITAR